MLRKIIFVLLMLPMSVFASANFNCNRDLQSIIVEGENPFLSVIVSPGEQTSVTQNQQIFQALTQMVDNGAVQVIFTPKIAGPVSLGAKLLSPGFQQTIVTITPQDHGCDVAVTVNNALLRSCSSIFLTLNGLSLVCLDGPSAYPVKLRIPSVG